MGEFSHNSLRGVQFDLVDLPPEGVDLAGEASPEELGLLAEERLRYLSPVEYHLHLEAINGGADLLARGTLAVTVEARCDRCDEPFSWRVTTEDVCHEVENAFGTTVDLSDGLREDILMSFPQRFLCREECQGLCSRCGANLNQGPCGCPGEDSSEEDPWSALDGVVPGE